MKNEKDIQDDEIRVIGGGSEIPVSKNRSRKWKWSLVIVCLVAFGCVVHALLRDTDQPEPTREEPTYFEPQPVVKKPVQESFRRLTRRDTTFTGVELLDTVINDIPLRVYLPHDLEITLHVGRLNKRDTSIRFAAQAADIRRDNRKILGAFVLKGKPLAWGLSKKGYCAIINGKVTIGVADNSPLFEEATDKGGYFFRQYPLVDSGRLVENEPKNKSIRRAFCDRNGELMVVESLSKESFHDFAQALVDLDVTNAIYLVGSDAYGWAVNDRGERLEFGVENRRLPKNTSYIVWRKRR